MLPLLVPRYTDALRGWRTVRWRWQSMVWTRKYYCRSQSDQYMMKRRSHHSMSSMQWCIADGVTLDICRGWTNQDLWEGSCWNIANKETVYIRNPPRSTPIQNGRRGCVGCMRSQTMHISFLLEIVTCPLGDCNMMMIGIPWFLGPKRPYPLALITVFSTV